MSTFQLIKQTMKNMPHGAVFSCSDFLPEGSRAAVDQALYRLNKAGAIVRVARGLYAIAGQGVAPVSVTTAVAQKTGERIGFIEKANDVLWVPTSGPSRTLKVAGQTLNFRRMSQRKVQLSQTPNGQVLLELWTRGTKNLTTLEIKRATGDWSDAELDAYATLIPAWLRTAIAQANTQRKSAQIGLSGAYDWSNPHIKDNVLIGQVLEKHKFDDVVRLCLFYGVPKVRRVFRRREFDSITSASVTRMLGNISKGLKQEVQHAQA